MTWPTFGDVLPILTVLAAVAAFVWTLGRIFRPWMGEEARKANEALYERLKNNDFKHVEDRVAVGLEGVNKRLDGIDGRLDRMEVRAQEERNEMRPALEEVRRNVAVLAAARESAATNPSPEASGELGRDA